MGDDGSYRWNCLGWSNRACGVSCGVRGPIFLGVDVQRRGLQINHGMRLRAQVAEADFVHVERQGASAVHLVGLAHEAARALILGSTSFVVHFQVSEEGAPAG